MNKNNTYIYALKDPITKHVRYIGKSNNVENRLRSHIRQAKNKNNYKNCWINSLLIKNLKPELEVLDEVLKENWQHWEKWWIATEKEKIKALGLPKLTNGTEGGDGGATFTGMHHSENVKLKIGLKHISKVLSKETKMRISKAKIGIKMSNDFKQKISNVMMGRKHSEETKRKISESNKISMKGKILSDEHKKNISEGLKKSNKYKNSRTSIEYKNKISNVVKNVWSKRSKEERMEITKNWRNSPIKNKELWKERISKAGKGKKRTEETKRKMSEAKRGIRKIKTKSF